jgi:hypothetical protein
VSPFLLLFVAVSCTERIDLTLDETYTRLVVDGALSDDSAAHRIALTRTAGYFYNEPAPRVTGATVTLSDEALTASLHETVPGVSGIYETDSSFAGTIGHTYTLDIRLPQAIDRETHYAATCRLMPVTRLDSIQVVFQPDWGKNGFWEIRVFAQEPGDQTNFYMFHYYRNDTLMTDSIWKVFYSDDRYFNGNYINGLTAVYIDNEHPWETIRSGDKVTLQMSGITKEYYDFLKQVQSAGFNIPFFNGPPANVVGNVTDGGVGFFASYSNSWASKTIR